MSVNVSAGKVTIKLLPDKVESPGIFPITVKAIDDSEQETIESFSIIILDELPIIVVEVEQEIKPIEAWIESISSTGLMEIRFSDPVIPIANFTNITE